MSLLTSQHFSNEVIEDLSEIPPPQLSFKDSFNTSVFISSLIYQSEITEEHDLILDRLCKKIDVAKRICKVYSQDLKQALDKKPIDQKFLKGLSVILIHKARENKDLKLLNTAFKIIDIHLENKPHHLMLMAEKVLTEVML